MASPSLQSEATPLPHDCVSYNAIGSDLETGLTKAGKANRHIAISSSSNAADDAAIKSESPTQGPLSAFVAKNEGLLLVAASQAFFALMNVAVKLLNSIDPPVTALELILVRMAITYAGCLTYMLLKNVPHPILGPPGVRRLLVLRGFCGFFGLFGTYYSLQYLSLSDATVLTFLAPLCTAVAGALILKETFKLREAIAGLMSIVGVMFIARPEFLFGSSSPSPKAPHLPPIIGGAQLRPPGERGTPTERLVAVGASLVGVLGATGAYITIRAIGKRAHALHAMSYFSSQCVITAISGLLITRVDFVIPTRIEWLAMLIMIGVFGFVAQFLLTLGLQRETAGRGTMAIYVQIIFATVLEFVFFHTTPSLLSICGTVIIMSSAIYVALTKAH